MKSNRRSNTADNGLTFIDLFAGSGGMSLGLELAGFRPIFVSELNRDAMETYLVNRRHRYPNLDTDKAFDIFDVTQRDGELSALVHHMQAERGVHDVDLIVGGPPCQGYSRIGHRRTFTGIPRAEVPSNHLYRDMACFITAFRPKLFLFENVQGLLSGRWTPLGEKGEIWADVRRTFEGIDGYDVRSQVVQAGQFGVPQRRPRVLLVGVRRDVGWRPMLGAPAEGLLPIPGVEAPDPVDVLCDLVDPDSDHRSATPTYPRDASNDVQEWFRRDPATGRVAPSGAWLSEHSYTRHSARVTEKFRYMLLHDSKIRPEDRTKKFGQRVIPRTWGPSGPSITMTSLPDDYVHFSQPRILTVREWARFQTFPDWYQFTGKRTTGGRRRAGNPELGDWSRELPKYTQIGNAVPVWLAKAVGEHFRSILD